MNAVCAVSKATQFHKLSLGDYKAKAYKHSMVRASISSLFGFSPVFSRMCLDGKIPLAIVDHNRVLALFMEVSSAILTPYDLNNSISKCSLLTERQ